MMLHTASLSWCLLLEPRTPKKITATVPFGYWNSLSSVLSSSFFLLSSCLSLFFPFLAYQSMKIQQFPVVWFPCGYCNTPGIMVNKIGHVIICIAKQSCFSQPWCVSTKTSLHFLGWLSSGDVWLESKTLVLNAISNTWIIPYVIWGVKLCFTLVSSIVYKPKSNN
jgi:hypothetical protein